jgi:hypothetical protein
MISSFPGTLLYAGSQAMTAGIARQDAAAAQVAASSTGSDPTEGIIGSIEAQAQVSAGAAVVKSADETLEELVFLLTR